MGNFYLRGKTGTWIPISSPPGETLLGTERLNLRLPDKSWVAQIDHTVDYGIPLRLNTGFQWETMCYMGLPAGTQVLNFNEAFVLPGAYWTGVEGQMADFSGSEPVLTDASVLSGYSYYIIGGGYKARTVQFHQRRQTSYGVIDPPRFMRDTITVIREYLGAGAQITGLYYEVGFSVATATYDQLSEPGVVGQEVTATLSHRPDLLTYQYTGDLYVPGMAVHGQSTATGMKNIPFHEAGLDVLAEATARIDGQYAQTITSGDPFLYKGNYSVAEMMSLPAIPVQLSLSEIPDPSTDHDSWVSVNAVLGQGAALQVVV